MKTKTFTALSVAVLALGSLSPVWTSDEANAARYHRAVVPAGAAVDVRLDTKISTEHATEGDTWSGTVVQPVYADGRVVIPSGSPVTGVVTSTAQGTHNTRASLTLATRRVSIDGRSYSMYGDTEPIIAGTKRAKKVGAIVGGAAAGALIGNAVSKGKKGAVIGGLLGGAAGYGLTRNALRTLQLKPGTMVRFTTREELVARRL